MQEKNRQSAPRHAEGRKTEMRENRSGRPPRANSAVAPNVRTEVAEAGQDTVRIVRVRTNADRVMLALILLLLALGSIMVFSASYPSALAEYNDSMHYIKRQLIFIVIGVGCMIVTSLLPPAFYKKISPLAFGVAALLLVVVLIPGIGISNGVARRWLGIRGTSFTFQPSELMKVALVMMLAWYIDKYRHLVLNRTDKRKYLVRGTLVPCVILGIACVLVLLEKHLSGTVILGMIGVCVLFIGGVHPGWMSLVGLGGGAVAIGTFLVLNPYALKRLTTFTDENADKLNELWQTNQGLLAIGSGGTLGVGLGGSRQKYSYVSEAQNDFIFTIWCEEMGFVGAVVLILLFLAFVFRGYVIAMRAPDTFSALLVFGIISQVGIQAFLNIGVVTDILPNTGVSLPFFSYGGTSLVILLAEMGIVLSVSKHSYQKKQ